MLEKTLLILIFWVFVATSGADATTKSDEVLLRAKEHAGEACLAIDVIKPQRIAVAIKNCGRHPFNILAPGTSYGDSRWRLFRVRDGHVDVVYQTYTHGYAWNFPAIETLQPGEQRKYVLDLQRSEWEASGGNNLELRKSDVVIVSYDVPFDQDADRVKAWYGVICAVAIVK